MPTDVIAENNNFLNFLFLSNFTLFNKILISVLFISDFLGSLDEYLTKSFSLTAANEFFTRGYKHQIINFTITI